MHDLRDGSLDFYDYLQDNTWLKGEFYIMKTTTKLTLSKPTIQILKNFSAINSNLLIRPGNKLVTMSSYN